MGKLSPDNWQDATLGEILTFQRGFDITKKELQSGPYEVIFSSGSQGVHNQYKVKAPGVVIGRKGTLGTVFFASKDFWPTDTTLWVKDFHGNDPKYAYYFLQTMHLEQYDVGAANPTLNRNHIHQLPIRYPPLPIQYKIAAILSAYDDLIENNTRRIAILEHMAQAIYREWFVHFRFPGYKRVKQRENIWECRKIGDLPIQIIDGDRSSRYPKRHELQDNGVLFLNTTNIKDNKLDLSNSNFISHEKFAELRKGRLQPLDIVMTTRGSIGKVALFNCEYSTGFINAQMLILRADNKVVDQFFLFYLLCSNEFQDAVQGFASGAAQPQIPIKDLSQIEIICPPIDVQHKFSQIVREMNGLIKNFQTKNTTLRQTRDLLLPRLIAGEVDVSALAIDLGEN